MAMLTASCKAAVGLKTNQGYSIVVDDQTKRGQISEFVQIDPATRGRLQPKVFG